LAHPEVARGLEQELIHALVTCLTTADVHQDAAANSNRATIMVRFEEVLAEHLRRPPDLPEMCELIGVTDRTSRSCCAEFLGISPSRYLRLRRLKLVRSALRDADPDTASVPEVARRFGVSQLGRFAMAYRTAFGETPSSTLRHRHRIGIILAVVPDSA
jgi:transcriptional regulator GlxA family with amidase domain